MSNFVNKKDNDGCVVAVIFFLLITLLVGLVVSEKISENWHDITRWWNKTEISVKGESGEKFHSYQAACEAQDFAAAHQYVVKMEEASRKDRTIKEDDILDAKEYVFKKEAAYLLLDQGENGERRALYYLKELPRDIIVSCASHLIDLAIMVKNSGLAYNALEILINSVKRGDNNYIILENIDEISDKLLDFAISNADKELANKILLLFYNSHNKKNAHQKYDEAVKSGAFNRQ